MMNVKPDFTNILFLDIECVSAYPDYDKMPELLQPLWDHKARQVLRKKEEETEPEEIKTAYQEKAAIFAEFGKIICISVGIARRDKESGQLQVRLKSYANHDEAVLLKDFSELIEKYYANTFQQALCGHNAKEFDIPYICRRMLINNIPLPGPLQLSGKKPWEAKHILDTMEMWGFGDRKNFTSLKLLAAVLDFPSPKDDIDGSQVGRVYWEDNDLERIALYCEKDVLATMQLFLRYHLEPLLDDEQVAHVS